MRGLTRLSGPEKRFPAVVPPAYGDRMQLKVPSLAERPGDHERVVAMAGSWPEFVTRDLVGDHHYGRIAREFPAYVLFAEDERGEVVATGFSVPFALDAEGRGELPARGWDEVLLWGAAVQAPRASRSRISPLGFCAGTGSSYSLKVRVPGSLAEALSTRSRYGLPSVAT